MENVVLPQPILQMAKLIRTRLLSNLLSATLLLIFFSLAVTSIRDKSPTFDEQGFLVRGVAYLRDQNQHIRVGHPLGLNAINGLFLAADKKVALPDLELEKQNTDFHRPAEMFMWEIGNEVDHIMFLGRLPTIWLGVLMAALAGRWTWRLSGVRWSGLFTLFLMAFDPNILAHMRLATTDLGLTAAALFAGMMLWAYWLTPDWKKAALVGISFGLLQNTKFTAGLYIPLFALVIVVAAVRLWRQSPDRRFPFRPLLLLLIAYVVVGLLTLWAGYGFQVGQVPEDLPLLSQLNGITLPLSHHLEQLLDIGGRMQKSTPSFLLGQYSDSGWWYYFPVAFLLKTPLPVLFIFIWAFWRLLRCKIGRSSLSNCPTMIDTAALLVPPIGYFLIALTTDINLGYRHLLPVLPFLYVFSGVMLSANRLPARFPFSRPVNNRVVTFGLMVWIVLGTLFIYPHFLAFFNPLAGGPDGGWRYLVDSNLDWGQDLKALGEWVDEKQIDSVWLSYFGEARPEYYGIPYVGLDSYPPRLMNAEAQPFYPSDPAPGTYAISATNLMGVHFDDHDQFDWFRNLKPRAKIGYSIFIYDVAAIGDQAEVVLGGIQPYQIRIKDYELFGTNDVVFRWVDTGQALIIPDESPWWLVLSRQEDVASIYRLILGEVETVAETSAYQIFRAAVDEPRQQSLAVFKDRAGSIELVELPPLPESVLPGEIMRLETRWLKHGQPQPLAIFIHILDDSGTIVAQWDDLGIAWEGWRDGDLLWQTHAILMPSNLTEGLYDVYVGLYDPDSGQRLLVDDIDRYYQGQISVKR